MFGVAQDSVPLLVEGYCQLEPVYYHVRQKVQLQDTFVLSERITDNECFSLRRQRGYPNQS